MFCWDSHTKKKRVKCLRHDITLVQGAPGYIGGKQYWVKMSKVALPARERCRPVSTIGYENVVELHRTPLRQLNVLVHRLCERATRSSPSAPYSMHRWSGESTLGRAESALLQAPLVAASGGKEGTSEDSSRSGKGRSPSALPAARVVFPIVQQPCGLSEQDFNLSKA